MSNNASFVQYYFKVISFTYNINLDALSIETRTNFFLECFNTAIKGMASTFLRLGLDLDGSILDLSFEI